jgi:hypothetical protein
MKQSRSFLCRGLYCKVNEASGPILSLPRTDLFEPYLITAGGDVLRTFDVSSLQEPECLSEIDGH